MSRWFLALVLAVLLPLMARAAEDAAGVEQRIALAAHAKGTTIVHFWAPWCPNCRSELSDGKWSSFIAAHPDVHFVFVTIWSPKDGRELLAKNGVGAQPNLTLIAHPNGSRHRGEMVSGLLGMPISWIPTTWIFHDGSLTYALNYGELRFPMLDQLIRDSVDSWEH